MTKKENNHKKEIIGIVYLAAALLFALAFYFKGSSGLIGELIRMIGQGLVGISAYAFPVLLLYMSLEYFFEKESKISSARLFYTIILLISLSAIIHVFAVPLSEFKAYIGKTHGKLTATNAIIELWKTGVQGFRFASTDTIFTGGVLGGGLAFSLTAIGEKAGALIILFILLLVQGVLIFNVSLSGAIIKTRDKVDTAIKNRARTLKENNQVPVSGQSGADFDMRVGEEKEITTKEGSFEIPLFLRGKKKKSGEEENGVVHGEKSDEKTESGHLADVPITGFFANSQDEGLSVSGQTEPKTFGPGGFPNYIHTKKEGKSGSDKDEDEIVILPAGIKHLGKEGEESFPAGIRKLDLSGKTSPESGNTQIDGQLKEKEKGEKDGSQDMVSQPVSQSGQKSSVKEKPQKRPYVFPPINLLKYEESDNNIGDTASIRAMGAKLEKTLESFGISAKVVNITNGPVITRFELTPGTGVKVSKIVSLADDIALNLAAVGVRIEAPIPGKSAIGIEVPNKQTANVSLRRLIESPEFKRSKSHLSAALGRDIPGNPVIADITMMPHILVAGATGSGKSVCLNSILISMLYKASPDDVKLLMIDPKVVELTAYNGIPHLIAPVVTNPKKAAKTLQWAVNEMTRRYALFAEKGVRDIHGYNQDIQDGDEERLPLILVVIDELSDLMATSANEVEEAIARLTAMARAAGMHLIIATQRPSVDVITGVIKANIPSRISFAVSSQVDSRTILDMGGAEKLLGKGDMLYFPVGASKPLRAQGAFVSSKEVEAVTEYVKKYNSGEYNEEVTAAINAVSTEGSQKSDSAEEEDECFVDAVTTVVEEGYASISLLQRRLNLGYPRAARLVDRMYEKGLVGGFEGSKPRKVLITREQWAEYRAREGV